MADEDFLMFYNRNMPHHQPLDATYAVMFRLAGSLPAEAIERLRIEREEYRNHLSGMTDDKRRNELFRQHIAEHFEKFQSLLDQETTGPQWLRNPHVAELVARSMHYWDGRAYELLAYCIMPNHVHVVFSIGSASSIRLPEHPLKGQTPYVVTNILTSIKKYTAVRANKVLKRSGQFWQDESFDHIIRDGAELEKTIWYVVFNPVKAGLVNDWPEWRWSYLKPGLIG